MRKTSSLRALGPVLLLWCIGFGSAACEDNPTRRGQQAVDGFYYVWFSDDEPLDRGPGFVELRTEGDRVVAYLSCSDDARIGEGELDSNRLVLTLDDAPDAAPGLGMTLDGTRNTSGDFVGQTSTGRSFRLERTHEHACDPAVPTEVQATYPESLLTSAASDTTSCEALIQASNPLPLGRDDDDSEVPGTQKTSTVSSSSIGGSLTVVETQRRASDNRSVSDTPLVKQEEYLFPGQVLQGERFLAGDFVGIPGHRSEGAITLRNVTLKSGCPVNATVTDTADGDASTFQQSVEQAIHDLLACGVEGTVANINYDVTQIYSYDHLLFSMGIDTRYGPFSLKNSLSIDSTKQTNYVLLRFQQVFYDVAFAQPAGHVFSNPDGCSSATISPTNSPLYVSSMGYGRVVFFLLESEYSAQDLKDTMSGAYEGATSTTKVKSGLTHQQVMQHSTVHYTVYGGGARFATGPIHAASPDKMYDTVKAFIADEKASDYSPANPGAPIRYTLRYVKNDATAVSNYSLDYHARTVSPKLATHHFYMQATNINHSVTFHIADATGKDTKVADSQQSLGVLVPIDPNCATSAIGCKRTLSYYLWNGDCGSSGVHFFLNHNNTDVWTKHYHHGISTCGKQYEAKVEVDLQTGTWTKISSRGYHGARWDSPDW